MDTTNYPPRVAELMLATRDLSAGELPPAVADAINNVIAQANTAAPRPLAAIRDDARAILEASIARVANTAEPAFHELEALRHAVEVWRILNLAVPSDEAAEPAERVDPGAELAGRVWEYIAQAPGLANASNLADQAVALIAEAGVARGEV